MKYFSPWWIILSQKKTPEFTTQETLSICLWKLNSKKGAMKGMTIQLSPLYYCLKTKTMWFFSPDTQISNTSTDLGDFLVRSYAKQIRERNATTGNYSTTFKPSSNNHSKVSKLTLSLCLLQLLFRISHWDSQVEIATQICPRVGLHLQWSEIIISENCQHWERVVDLTVILFKVKICKR